VFLLYCRFVHNGTILETPEDKYDFSFDLNVKSVYRMCTQFIPKVKKSNSHSWLITGFVTRLTRRVPLVAQELLTIAEHPSSPQVFSGVSVTRSLVLCVCFVERCLSFCTFSFGHCAVCSSSIYGFWLLFWYLQTPLNELLSLGKLKSALLL
jgi:hypothetical protein